ncbi:MAG: T9SS type A sorting domain-containing protein [Flavobacteriales bacterium]|nr:T9SS type A sorting domain-containing protein [Flavobacteriales bacterium]
MSTFHTSLARCAIGALLTVGSLNTMRAQTITGYRYWFDDAVANATSVPVSGAAEFTLNATLEASVLAPGHHRVTIQLQDSNGDYGVPITSLFAQRGSAIAGYRYWFDDDAANAIDVAGTGDYTLGASLEASALDNGYHRVTMQLRDGIGEYASPVTTTFVQRGVTVSGYEYWIDDEIANTTAASIGPSGVVNLIADLPTGVPAGTHTFTIHFSGTNGTWSVPLTTQFNSFVSIEELPGISDLLLFPNPVTDELGLRLSSDASRTLNLQVLDITGAVVIDLSSWGVSGTAYRNWDISNLASGTYLLRIQDGTGTSNLRFVKR